MIVTADSAVQPIGGVTGFAAKSNDMPPGAPELPRFTGEKNTPSDWTAIVEVTDPPGGINRDEGEARIVKSATPAPMVTVRFTLWVSELLFPVTRKVNVPVEA